LFPGSASACCCQALGACRAWRCRRVLDSAWGVGFCRALPSIGRCRNGCRRDDCRPNDCRPNDCRRDGCRRDDCRVPRVCSDDCPDGSADDSWAADSPNFHRSRDGLDSRRDADDTTGSADDKDFPIRPRRCDCNRRGAIPNSIPSRPIPTVGYQPAARQSRSQLRKKSAMWPRLRRRDGRKPRWDRKPEHRPLADSRAGRRRWSDRRAAALRPELAR
jgi:hypothetical protein